MRGRAWAAMECLVQAMEGEVEEQLRIYCKPKKSVSTQLAIEAGKLRLAPEPTSVKILGAESLRADEDQPHDRVEVTLTRSPLDDSKYRVFLTLCVGESAVAPFWCVEQVADPEEANMTLVWYKISSVSGMDPSDEQGEDAFPAASARLELQRRKLRGRPSRSASRRCWRPSQGSRVPGSVQ